MRWSLDTDCVVKNKLRIKFYVHFYFLRRSYTISPSQYRSWLRYYATSWKVAGSRPDEVTEFFQFT
jgi:hypothetical protein